MYKRQVFDRWINTCDFPVLGANIIDTSTGEPHLPPYKVMERDGVKIVILGMITPAIPAWLSENLWKGLRFDDMEETARKWMKIIREKENPDLMIGLFHAGQEAFKMSGKYNENAVSYTHLHPGLLVYTVTEANMLLSVLTPAVILLYFERRPFSDLGLTLKGHVRGLWYGLLVAMLLYLIGFGLSLAIGEVEVTGFQFDPLNLLGTFVFCLLVALTEEIMMRGYILGRLLHTRMNKFLALFVSALLFALLHIFNPNVAFLPMQMCIRDRCDTFVY